MSVKLFRLSLFAALYSHQTVLYDTIIESTNNGRPTINQHILDSSGSLKVCSFNGIGLLYVYILVQRPW